MRKHASLATGGTEGEAVNGKDLNYRRTEAQKKHRILPHRR